MNATYQIQMDTFDREAHEGRRETSASHMEQGQPRFEDQDRSSATSEKTSYLCLTIHKFRRVFLTKETIYLALLFSYHIFLIYAIYYHAVRGLDWLWCDGLGFVIICTLLVWFGKFISRIVIPLLRRSRFIQKWFNITQRYLKKHFKDKVWVQFAGYGLVLGSIAVFLIVDSVGNRKRLVSAGGILVFVFLGAICSKHPRRINWKQVTWGLVLQFLFALLILRWEHGKVAIECIGAKVDNFLVFTDEGTKLVYGHLVHRKPFIPQLLEPNSVAFNVTSQINQAQAVSPVVAFKALTVVYFFSFVCNILFFLGIIQSLTMKIGWVLKITIGTTACESLTAASNIFLGQAMAPLLIQPYLDKMTKSEIHSIMTSGFATIAGTVMAAYITFGVSAAHLLSASVMSAPAALACAKLLYPETEQSQTSHENIQLKGNRGEDGEASNLLDAATRGASIAANLVLNIIAIVIAFVAMIAFLNSMTGFFFGLVGLGYVNFEFILGKLFIPMAYIMGIDWEETEAVGRLIGIKTVVNEFIAYRELGVAAATNQLSSRSVVIATYALCGFANPGSVGVQLAILSNLCPEKKALFANIIGRAFVAGSMACFLTACIAGALLTEDGINSLQGT